ncbi:hypothetical protein [Mangrovicoccus ximenensis]|uniref:hypothetical protein n=1 Tax=Mangrovicoccus ximenensis TaxID=1911570 RepID=UPI0011AE9A16|nr:hypothetical protein [Mangrovicoccus ximenensis]
MARAANSSIAACSCSSVISTLPRRAAASCSRSSISASVTLSRDTPGWRSTVRNASRWSIS